MGLFFKLIRGRGGNFLLEDFLGTVLTGPFFFHFPPPYFFSSLKNKPFPRLGIILHTFRGVKTPKGFFVFLLPVSLAIFFRGFWHDGGPFFFLVFFILNF